MRVFEMLKEGPEPLKNSDSNFNVLDDVLDTLRFRGSIFFHSSLAAPWGMSLSSHSPPRFHIALEGGFYVGAGQDQVAVGTRDIVILSEGREHWIADQPGRKLVPSAQAGDACELGRPLFQEGGITNRLMCGLVEYDDASSHPIISVLPPIFHLSGIHAADNIWLTVQQIDAEIVRSQSRKNLVIDRLAEVLCIQVMHRYTSENQHLEGFLLALKDPRLARILQLIHQHAEHHWTLDTLGAAAAMSRATLQRRFKDAVGQSPMSYLGQWRMSRAYQLLKYSNASLDDIAAMIGFADARTLRTAFQREYQLTPSELRKSSGNGIKYFFYKQL
jgi:AraC-like DNA-binding protein